MNLEDLSEKEWSNQLVGTAGKPGLARTLGWTTCYHTLRSKGSTSGFPDWVLVRERVLFLELKTEKGKVSEAQAEWIRALTRAGGEAYVVRPRHLEEIAHVLTRRGIGAPRTATEVALLQEAGMNTPALADELGIILAAGRSDPQANG